MHSLKATIEIDNDGIIENNTVYTYDYVESFSDILVIQGFEGESEEIKALLGEYEVTVLTIGADEMPKNIEELRGYSTTFQMPTLNVTKVSINFLTSTFR